MQKKFLKYYLKEFYKGINSEIWNYCIANNISIYDNLLFNCTNNVFDTIKYFISTLILQQKSDIVDYFSVQLCRLKELHTFDNMNFDFDDDRLKLSMLLKPRVLIIKEFGDQNFKAYKDFISTIFCERHIKKKNTIIIITTKTIEYLVADNILENFKVINYTNEKMLKKNNIKNNSTFDARTVVLDDGDEDDIY